MSYTPTPIDAYGIWFLDRRHWSSMTFVSPENAMELAKICVRERRSPVIVAHLVAPAAHRMIRVEPDGTETVVEPGTKGDIGT